MAVLRKTHEVTTSGGETKASPQMWCEKSGKCVAKNVHVHCAGAADGVPEGRDGRVEQEPRLSVPAMPKCKPQISLRSAI